MGVYVKQTEGRKEIVSARRGTELRIENGTKEKEEKSKGLGGWQYQENVSAGASRPRRSGHEVKIKQDEIRNLEFGRWGASLAAAEEFFVQVRRRRETNSSVILRMLIYRRF